MRGLLSWPAWPSFLASKVLGVGSGVLAVEHEPSAELVRLNDQLVHRPHGLVTRRVVLVRLWVVLQVRVREGAIACL